MGHTIKEDRDLWLRIAFNGRIIRASCGWWNLYNTRPKAYAVLRKLRRCPMCNYAEGICGAHRAQEAK